MQQFVPAHIAVVSLLSNIVSADPRAEEDSRVIFRLQNSIPSAHRAQVEQEAGAVLARLRGKSTKSATRIRGNLKNFIAGMKSTADEKAGAHTGNGSSQDDRPAPDYGVTHGG